MRASDRVGRSMFVYRDLISEVTIYSLLCGGHWILFMRFSKVLMSRQIYCFLVRNVENQSFSRQESLVNMQECALTISLRCRGIERLIILLIVFGSRLGYLCSLGGVEFWFSEVECDVANFCLRRSSRSLSFSNWKRD